MLRWLAVLAVFFLGNNAFASTLEEWVNIAEGVDLRTEITLPDATLPPYPVLLVRSTYPFDELPETALAFDYTAMFGYAVVLQYTRGVDGSGGKADAFLSDRADGLATIDWVLAQDWCNGDILMGGVSALGITAYLAAPGAPVAPAGVGCFLMAESTPDVYLHAAFHGGVFKKRDVEAWLRWSDATDMLDVLAEHRTCDEYWDSVRVADMGEGIFAPALHLGGWFDVFTQGTLDGFKMFGESLDANVAENQYLIIGPWTHFDLGSNKAGALTFPENAKWDFVAGMVGWAIWCFEGHHDVVDEWPRVQYYTMGDVDDPAAPGNEWRQADDWPPEHVDTPYYLGGIDGAAPGGSGNFGGLYTSPPNQDFLVTVPVDVSNPVPTRGGRNLASDWGPKDLSNIESRDDVVVFSTPILDEPVEATGRVKVQVWIATKDDDADVAVRLSDVFPDGRSMLVTEGIQRLSARDGCEAMSVVTSGAVMLVEVDLWSTSWVFNRGHRIRISISGTNSPRYEINPAWLATSGPSSGFTLAVGTMMPSALILPVPVTESGDAEIAEVAEVAETAEFIETSPELGTPDASLDAGVVGEDVAEGEVERDDIGSALSEDVSADADSELSSDADFVETIGGDANFDFGRDAGGVDVSPGDVVGESTKSDVLDHEFQPCVVVTEGCSAGPFDGGRGAASGLILLAMFLLVVRWRLGSSRS